MSPNIYNPKRLTIDNMLLYGQGSQGTGHHSVIRETEAEADATMLGTYRRDTYPELRTATLGANSDGKEEPSAPSSAPRIF